MIDYRGVLRALVGGGAALGGYAIAVRPRLLRLGATDDEAHRTLPGDELIPNADGQSTMATTLPAAPDQVWPWLAQMGCNRAGWYSWDRLDNFGRPSAEQIVPDWQHLAEGDHLDAVPSGASWFSVALVDPPHHLVLRTHLTLPSGRVFDLHGPPRRRPPTGSGGSTSHRCRPGRPGSSSTPGAAADRISLPPPFQIDRTLTPETAKQCGYVLVCDTLPRFLEENRCPTAALLTEGCVLGVGSTSTPNDTVGIYQPLVRQGRP